MNLSEKDTSTKILMTFLQLNNETYPKTNGAELSAISKITDLLLILLLKNQYNR